MIQDIMHRLGYRHVTQVEELAQELEGARANLKHLLGAVRELEEEVATSKGLTVDNFAKLLNLNAQLTQENQRLYRQINRLRDQCCPCEKHPSFEGGEGI